jgi:hypothetical protein
MFIRAAVIGCLAQQVVSTLLYKRAAVIGWLVQVEDLLWHRYFLPASHFQGAAVIGLLVHFGPCHRSV